MSESPDDGEVLAVVAAVLDGEPGRVAGEWRRLADLAFGRLGEVLAVLRSAAGSEEELAVVMAGYTPEVIVLGDDVDAADGERVLPVALLTVAGAARVFLSAACARGEMAGPAWVAMVGLVPVLVVLRQAGGFDFPGESVTEVLRLARAARDENGDD